MGLIQNIRLIEGDKCWFCGWPLTRTPVALLNGAGGRILLHAKCISKLYLILKMDLKGIDSYFRTIAQAPVVGDKSL